jgi:hypothetical protein
MKTRRSPKPLDAGFKGICTGRATTNSWLGSLNGRLIVVGNIFNSQGIRVSFR